MGWIKLATRTRDHKIMRLASLTGVDRRIVFCSIVNWFWYLDDYYTSDLTLTVTDSHFHDITDWSNEASLAAACAHADIHWLERAGPNLWRPTRPDSHFSSTAKSRASVAKRVSKHRNRNTSNVTTSLPRTSSISDSDSVSGSASGSESQRPSEPKPRAHCAPEILPAAEVSPFALALQRWAAAANVGWNGAAAYAVVVWEGQTLPVLGLPPEPPDALERIVGHLRRKGTAFRNVRFALGCVRNAIDEWGQSGVPPWEAVPQQAVQRAETPLERADRILAAKYGRGERDAELKIGG